MNLTRELVGSKWTDIWSLCLRRTDNQHQEVSGGRFFSMTLKKQIAKPFFFLFSVSFVCTTLFLFSCSLILYIGTLSSVQSLCYVSLQPHGRQHTRLPCPSPTPRACSNSCASSWWCHPTISPSVISKGSPCLQSFPASGSFPLSQSFASGDQSIGVSPSASVLPMNIQD